MKKNIRWKKALLLLGMIAALMIGASSLSYAGTVNVTSGKPVSVKGDTWFALKVTKPARLRVVVYTRQYNKTGTFGTQLTLCNSKKKSIDLRNRVYASKDNVRYYAVKAGVYYFHAAVAARTTTYFQVNVADWADSGKSTRARAAAIKRNTLVTGQLTAGEKSGTADWFKFTLSKNQKLHLNYAVYGYGGIRFTIYSKNLRGGYSTINLYKTRAGSLTNTTGNLKAGTYYLKVSRSGYYPRGSWAYAFRLR